MFSFIQNRPAHTGVARRASADGLAKNMFVIFLIASAIGTSIAQDVGWPREKSNASGAFIYYQPQLDEWKEFRRLEARMAISVTPTGGQPALGVVSFRARTDANLETRNVVVSRLEIISVRFPSLEPAKAAAMEKLVRDFLPSSRVLNINLDRLLAALDAAKPTSTPVVAVKNDPPRIFVAYDKAILLLVDGEAVRAPIEKGELEFVVNTNWNLFFDKADSKFYLLNERQWLSSPALEGPWTVTVKLPKALSKLPNQPNWADVKKAVPPPGGTGTAPRVFYSKTPAEIIAFKGQPNFATIANTQIAYATNTDSDVFLHDGEKQFYFLVAG